MPSTQRTANADELRPKEIDMKVKTNTNAGVTGSGDAIIISISP